MLPSTSTTPTIPVPMSIPLLCGSRPGLLDQSQIHRILATPNSTLIFASFNPRTATSLPQSDVTLPQDLLSQPPRRIVIECTTAGDVFWRFVPKAKRDEDVPDEGSWPRIVDICGDLFECTLEQWEIYKLDPLYECRVRKPPDPPIITPTQPPLQEPYQTGQRRPIVTDEDQTMHPPPKRAHIQAESEDEDDELEVESMVIDDPEPQQQFTPNPPPVYNSEQAGVKRKYGRDPGGAPQEEEDNDDDDEDDDDDDYNYPNTSYNQRRARTSPLKRKSGLFTTNIGRRSDDSSDELSPRKGRIFSQERCKRLRTTSPGSTRDELIARRLDRRRQRAARRKSDIDTRAEQREAQFLHSVFYEAHLFSSEAGRHFQRTESIPSVVMDDDISIPDETSYYQDFARSPSPAPQPVPSEYDDDAKSDTTEVPEGQRMAEDAAAAHAAMIEESRRKMADLEKDRPLWEEAARRRRTREQAEHYMGSNRSESRSAREAEATAARARAEAEAAAAARAKAEAEARVRAEQEREEAARRQQYDQARRQRRAQLEQLHQRWFRMPWTIEVALERYITLSEIFDSTKYTPENPISFEEIPWPVVENPRTLSLESVDWTAVEGFFGQLAEVLRASEYRTILEKSHKRFHPDRWRSRGILRSVVDEAERNCLEVAANTVAQALTPLWTDLKGR